MSRSEVYLFGYAYPTYWCTYCNIHKEEACRTCYVYRKIKNDRWMRIR